MYPNRADAIFAALAEYCGCIIVTEDGVGKKRGLIQVIKSNQGKVWSFDDLLEKLHSIN